jgi:hypothetical protein
MPSIPEYSIKRLNFHEVSTGMAADVSLSVANKYPINFEIPSLGFNVLVQNCGVNEPYIRLADAYTDVIKVRARSDFTVGVSGIVQEIPQSLIQACPDSRSSPLDLLLGEYLHGNDTTIFVRGSSSPRPNTPEWIAAMLSSITVPVPFPGRTFGNLVKNFSVTDTHFSLPGPSAEPDQTDPTISGNIVVVAAIPHEMNFNINITGLRSTADIFYKGKKLGFLNLKDWQPASSERVEPKDGEEAALKIEAKIKDAPIIITDDDVFTDVLQDYVFSRKHVTFKIVALVDAQISTVLGDLVIKDVPAEGTVPLHR